MYSRYMNGRFTPMAYQSVPDQGKQEQTTTVDRPQTPLSNIYSLWKQTAGRFNIKNMDTGDILLILIIILLFLEGDNLETVVTLGLLLFWGLQDDHEGL